MAQITHLSWCTLVRCRGARNRLFATAQFTQLQRRRVSQIVWIIYAVVVVTFEGCWSWWPPGSCASLVAAVVVTFEELPNLR